MQFPSTKDFIIEPNIKAQAIKVLEEASELVEAAKQYDRYKNSSSTYSIFYERYIDSRENAKEELCDVLQALANLAALLCLTSEEISEMYNKVVEKNTLRGRYE